MYETAPLLDDPIHNLRTIRDLYRWAITEMENADLSYGHGSPDAAEEASFLICRALKLPFVRCETFYDAALTHNELVRIVHLIDRRVHEAADFVGLDPALLERSPFELSGGQKRRVAVAGVMAMKPRILVLDEPAAGLDPEGRDEILSEVKEYHKKTGTTVLLVSHSMEDIAKYANRVLVMSNKKIAMYDTVEKVFARAPELLELGLSVPQVTKIFLKLREMGVDVPADVYTIPYAVKTLLEAKRRRDAGESLVLPRSAAQKGGAV